MNNWKEKVRQPDTWTSSVGPFTCEINLRWGTYYWEVFLEDYGQDWPPPKIVVVDGSAETRFEAGVELTKQLMYRFADWARELQESAENDLR